MNLSHIQNFRKSIICTALFLTYGTVYADITPLEQENIRLKHQQNLKLSNEGIQQATQLQKESSINHSADKNVNHTLSLVEKITIDTQSGDNLAAFKEITQQYIGTNLTTPQIYHLSKDLTEALYKAGYVTSGIGLKTDTIENGYIPLIVHWEK